jgi:multidrug transporter EmrE-like cation transporter
MSATAELPSYFFWPVSPLSSTWNGQDATGLRLNEPFLTTVIFIVVSYAALGHVMCSARLSVQASYFFWPVSPLSSTWNGQDATGLRLNEPFLTTVIFIVISYAALATSCASETSADSKLRL